MTTYDRIKEVLDVNFQMVTVKLEEIKEDVTEVKEHVKQTNGHVSANLDRIHELEIDQAQDNKFRKNSWFIVGSVAVLIAVEVLDKLIF